MPIQTSLSPSIQAALALRGGSMPHVPPPASPVSSRVRLVLQAGPEADPEVVITDPSREHGWRAAMEPASEPGMWSVEILLPQEPTVLTYYFELADGTILLEKRQKEGVVKPLFGVWEEGEFRLAVYQPSGEPPEWVKGQIFYQIFPDRFARSAEHPTSQIETTYGMPALHLPWDALPEHPPKGRDFFGGNLRGVIEKLDYLADLGVTCIYFTPIFESPTNHRYDAVDYFKIDPQLGTEDDLKDLLAQAGERGMRVLLDGVFNHCSKDSIYFLGAQRDRLSPYYRWFHFDEWPDAYEGWLKVQTMPEFVECPEVEDFFFGPQGVALHWLSYGIAGWRTDVTPWLTDEFWRRFRRAVRSVYPDAYLIAEDWGNATHRLLGNTFDSTMNYRFAYTVVGFARGRLSPLELDDRLETLRRDTPPGQFHVLFNLLDSHDTPRALTLLKGSRRRMKLAVALQMAYPGVPMLCYGDEAGLEGDYAENSRRPFPWDNPDRDLMDFYRRAIYARKASPALLYGDIETVWIDPSGGYAFARRHAGETVIAAFNNSHRAIAAEISLTEADSGLWSDLLGPLRGAECRGGMLRFTLPPFGSAWLRKGV